MGTSRVTGISRVTETSRVTGTYRVMETSRVTGISRVTETSRVTGTTQTANEHLVTFISDRGGEPIRVTGTSRLGFVRPGGEGLPEESLLYVCLCVSETHGASVHRSRDRCV